MRQGQARFARRSRLHEPAEFRLVFARPSRSVDRFFTVLARHNGRGYARLGLAISKKSARLATHRNRIKRVVRESFRLNPQRLEGLDIVVVTRGANTKVSNPVLFGSLQRHWEKLEALCERC